MQKKNQRYRSILSSKENKVLKNWGLLKQHLAETLYCCCSDNTLTVWEVVLAPWAYTTPIKGEQSL